MHPACPIAQVYLCRAPIDFRKSINGLSVLFEQELQLNPFGSALYVFVNRQRNKIKEKPSILPRGFTLPVIVLPTVLPTDVATLTALLLAQQQAHDASHTKALDYINYLFEQFLLARRRMFGSSSEQQSTQARLFDEAEASAATASEAQDIAPLPEEKPQDKPARGKRGPLPPELKRIDVVHDIPEADRICPCGTPMVLIGRDVSEQLDIVPMQVRVLRHIRLRYACLDGDVAPVMAALPPQPLPKSNASADFLAMLLTVKFVDGLPLYRFGKVLDRHGAPVPTQTLARWVIAASRMLQPLFNLILPLRQEIGAPPERPQCPFL